MTLVDDFGEALGSGFLHVQVGDDQHVLVIVRRQQETLCAADVEFVEALYNV